MFEAVQPRHADVHQHDFGSQPAGQGDRLSTGIPDAFFGVFGLRVLIVLAAAGIAIAMLGALLPAQWAARSRVTEVLQTE